MNLPSTDGTFLARPMQTVEKPLRHVAGVRRVYFSAGLGLGLGDQFMCAPLLESLCLRFPGKALHFLTDYPDYWRSRLPEGVRMVVRQQNDSSGVLEHLELGYDIAVLGYHPGCLEALSRQTRPTVFCAGTNLADFRAFYAAYGSCDEIPLNNCRNAVYEGDKFVALFEDFGIGPFPGWPWPSRALAERLSEADAPASAADTRILIHPAAGKDYKCWPIANWVAVTAALREAGMSVCISAGATAEDREKARQIAAAVPGVTVRAPMSIDRFLESLADYHLVLSADTVVPHAVAATDRSVSLAIYGPTDPLRFCPPGPRNYFLSPLSVTPAAVVNAVEGLLHLLRGHIDSLAAPGRAAALRQTFATIIDLMRDCDVETGASLRLMARALLARLDGCVAERYRAVLAGGEDTQARLQRSLATEPPERIRLTLEQSPVWRWARLLAGRNPGMRGAGSLVDSTCPGVTRHVRSI